jgi:hypothetical protein
MGLLCCKDWYSNPADNCFEEPDELGVVRSKCDFTATINFQNIPY